MRRLLANGLLPCTTCTFGKDTSHILSYLAALRTKVQTAEGEQKKYEAPPLASFDTPEAMAVSIRHARKCVRFLLLKRTVPNQNARIENRPGTCVCSTLSRFTCATNRNTQYSITRAMVCRQEHRSTYIVQPGALCFFRSPSTLTKTIYLQTNYNKMQVL